MEKIKNLYKKFGALSLNSKLIVIIVLPVIIPGSLAIPIVAFVAHWGFGIAVLGIYWFFVALMLLSKKPELQQTKME